ncbi:hypothetical protein [Natronosalvus caseinilyticus]|uniref:hypothetical protein n=1 Tax=Natronosalvus caseinilyticus TaxID=2953747 RepID=UPI0028A94591|nr:hypothetical protein [Natronosalvus caseinilyticus]
MLRSLLTWVLGRGDIDDAVDTGSDGDVGGFDGDDGDDGDNDGNDESRFVLSPLDRSVRAAHGGDPGTDRKLAALEERARELEDQRRE